MRASLELCPITSFDRLSGPIYSLQFIQEPRYARESTILKNTIPFQAVNIHKRLLHPFPILGLKIYRRDEKRGNLDITGKNLSYFFLRATIISRESRAIEPNSTSVNNSNNNNSHRNEIYDSSMTKRGEAEDDEVGKFRDDDDYPLIVGTKLISGIYYTLPKNEQVPNDKDEGIIVFIFSDIGFLKKGNYRMSFELFKYEPYRYLDINNEKLSQLSKVAFLNSDIIKVYGPREYYKKEIQEKIESELRLETQYINDDYLKNKVMNYLISISVIKDFEKNPTSLRKYTRKEEPVKNNEPRASKPKKKKRQQQQQQQLASSRQTSIDSTSNESTFINSFVGNEPSNIVASPSLASANPRQVSPSMSASGTSQLVHNYDNFHKSKVRKLEYSAAPHASLPTGSYSSSQPPLSNLSLSAHAPILNPAPIYEGAPASYNAPPLPSFTPNHNNITSSSARAPGPLPHSVQGFTNVAPSVSNIPPSPSVFSPVPGTTMKPKSIPSFDTLLSPWTAMSGNSLASPGPAFSNTVPIPVPLPPPPVPPPPAFGHGSAHSKPLPMAFSNSSSCGSVRSPTGNTRKEKYFGESETDVKPKLPSLDKMVGSSAAFLPVNEISSKTKTLPNEAKKEYGNLDYKTLFGMTFKK